jgi:hypothetical protein
VSSREELSVVIEDDGTVVTYADFSAVLPGLYADAVTVERPRASHVLPWDPVERKAFQVLRMAFGDSGAVAAWTRNWHTMWEVDLRPIGGPVLETKFLSHEAGVRAELGWLAKNYFATEV